MFEQFTARAQQIIKIFAQEEAKRLGHESIMSEHIFLGLLREGEGVAARILLNLGMDLDILKEEVEMAMPQGSNAIIFGETPLSPHAKKVLKLSQEEAKEMGHNYVGTEHLLLGVLQHTDNAATEILNAEGIDSELVREEIFKIMGTEPPSESLKKKKKKTPNLDKYSRNLTNLAREEKLDPVIGRDSEIDRIIHILSRRTKNNPVLVGEPGVGKTAIVEGLAKRISDGAVPEVLLDKKLVVLDLASVVAGTKYRGEFEERIKNILGEIEKAENIILFIDEIHNLIGAGGAEGALDAANILKPSLAKGNIRCIGATTMDEYRKYIEKDSALERRFQMVIIEEPSVEETIKILQGLRPKYEEFHKIKYSDQALESAVKLSYRYISDRSLPDKAIDIIDEAGAKVKIKRVEKPPQLIHIEKKIQKLNTEKSDMVSKQLYELAGRKRDEIKEIQTKYNDVKKDWLSKVKQKEVTVNEDDILNIVTGWTKIPVERLLEKEMDRLLRIEKELKKRVVGQDEAIEKVARAVRRSRTNIGDPRRPSGSFIFLGPSGVGKTQLGRTLAAFLFGDESALVRIDMSDFMEKHSVSRLTGAPPGYVGYEEGGILTEKVRRKPYSIVLFDEIEKAHPDVFNILLQVFEEGELSDNLGHVVDFRNTIIIMTSNIGASELDDEFAIGFEKGSGSKGSDKQMESGIKKKIKKIFRPEFLNRIDEIVVFKTLSEKSLLKVVDILIKEVEQRLQTYEVKLHLTLKAKKYLLREGYNKTYGARPLKRTIQREIEDQLAVFILQKKIKQGASINISFEKDKLDFKIE
ncbi:MAG: ATP-dependent Clp protease ATP-binding subunit [Spirochaetes bacterium]|nr:ATP-dependent Clp protease ATP-binding subunit [Spirochaetota bacterium]